jgi:hypothetical protein
VSLAKITSVPEKPRSAAYLGGPGRRLIGLLCEVSEWLAALYREPGRCWSRWQPDRLAETSLPAFSSLPEARPALAPVAAVATED